MTRAVDCVDVLGNTEIDDRKAAIRTKHEILRLEIAMQDTALVYIAQREHKFPEDSQRLVRCAGPPCEPLVEIAAVEEFHHQIGMTFGHSVAMNTRDVAALDTLDQRIFLHEACQRVLIGGRFAPENVHDERLIVPISDPDIPRHASFADEAKNPKARDAHPLPEHVAFHSRGEIRRQRSLGRVVGSPGSNSQGAPGQFLLALVVAGPRFHRANRDDLVARPVRNNTGGQSIRFLNSCSHSRPSPRPSM